MEMIDTNFIRGKRLQQTFANIPASARQAYDEANRRLSQSIKTADRGDQSPEVVERRKSSAASAVNAPILVTPEQARANITRAYEAQESKRQEVVSELSSAIERVRGTKARPETAQDKPTDSQRNRYSRVDTLADLLRESAQESE
jgi:hypothetical protein